MFIVFEGPEGAGKSTQARYLAKKLQKEGYNVLATKEPGGTQVGDAVREILLDPKFTINSLSEFLLYSASRAQLVREVINPALAQNKIVVCDRFLASSIAYQGYGRGLDLDLLYNFSKEVTTGLEPRLTFLLDIAIEKGLQRVVMRGGIDRLEQSNLSFHHRVRQGFLKLARANSSWRILNAEEAEEVLAEHIWQAVDSIL